MTRRAGVAAALSNASSGPSTARSSSCREVTTGSPASNRAVASSASLSTPHFCLSPFSHVTSCLPPCATPDPAIDIPSSHRQEIPSVFISNTGPRSIVSISSACARPFSHPSTYTFPPSLPTPAVTALSAFLTSVCPLPASHLSFHLAPSCPYMYTTLVHRGYPAGPG